MKVTKNQWIAIVVIVIILIAGIWYFSKKDKSPTPIDDSGIQPTTSQGENIVGVSNDLQTGDDDFSEIDATLDNLE